MSDEQDRIHQLGAVVQERGSEIERLRAINNAFQEKIERLEIELGMVYDALDETIDGANAIAMSSWSPEEVIEFIEKINSWRVVVDEEDQELAEEEASSE